MPTEQVRIIFTVSFYRGIIGNLYSSVLWFEKGLGQDIGQSLRLNSIALLTALFITVIVSYLAAFPAFQPIAFGISKVFA